MTRNFGRYQLEFVAVVRPATDETGKILEYAHQLPVGVRPNRYGLGPFCRFELRGAPITSGVYAITVGDDLKYIGECENLSERFGPSGYGYIAPRNCYTDGQATNCKVNSLILDSGKAGECVSLWFYATPDRRSIEAELVNGLHPAWNGRRGRGRSRSAPTPTVRASIPTAEDFRQALELEFASGSRMGARSVTIQASDLHRAGGGYPGNRHRMPLCCQVMRSLMRPSDSVIESPPSGVGASLKIEYTLPRPV